jgi:predicted small lipoprotein YifL
MLLKTSLGIILAFAVLLQGCGRKGPLTMPVAHPQKAAAHAASSVAAVPAASDIPAASSVPATLPAK